MASNFLEIKMSANAAAFPHSFDLCLHTQILEENSVSTMASYDHIMNEEKSVSTSKILVIGATGYIGRFVALAAVAAGHPTYALLRPTTAFDAAKEKCLHELKDSGVIIVYRFLPSEFGHDIDRDNPVEPGLSFYKEKRLIRRAVEAANIPYTYICCNSIAGWPYFYHTHPSELPPPQDQFEIYGDGNIKAYFVTGEDIGKYTIKAVEDVRTVNKIVHFRPPKNFLTLNELAAIWEKKIGKTLPRVCISEQDLLDLAKANNIPESIVASLTHDIFINGCQYNFKMEEPKDVEVCELYPEILYTTVQDFFDGYL